VRPYGSTQPKTGSSARPGQIVAIAVPAVFESIISVIIGAIDTKMISGLGKGAVSAVSFTSQPKLILLSIFFALGTAVSVFVAQALGRQDREEANAYFQTVLRITVSLSLVVGLLAGLLAGPIMSICNRQPDTVGMSVNFFRIIMFFLVFNAVSIVLNAALRGIGKTRLPMISSVAMGAGQYREVRDYVRLSRIAGAVVSVALGAVYILGARKFFSHYFQDEKDIAQGISYTYVAAALAFLQIIRIINVAAMRGMGDAKSPRIMATVCVLLVNPAVAFMLTSVLPCGVWGIWIASLTSHLCWFTMSCVLEHRCMREALRLTA